MTIGFLNACSWLAAAGGTANLVPSSAMPGLQTPASAGAVDGTTYRYYAHANNRTQWELGVGVYTAAGGQARTTILASSNAGAVVSFSVPPVVTFTLVAYDLKDPVASVNVQDFGAVGNGVADDSAAFAAAVTALGTMGLAGGGTVVIPGGRYYVPSGITDSSKVVRFLGVGKGGTTVSCNTPLETSTTGTDVQVFTLTNRGSSIEQMAIFGYNNPAATKAAVVLTSNAVEAHVRDCYVIFGKYNLDVAAPDHILENLICSQAYGSALVRTTANGFHRRLKLDHQGGTDVYPAVGTVFAARANGTPYTLNTIVSSGGFLLQCSQVGTSGGSPPTILAYNNAIVDGTARWLLLAPQTFYALQVDAGSFVLETHQCDYSGHYLASVAIVNTIAGSDPSGITLTDNDYAAFKYGVFSDIASYGLRLTGGPNFAGFVDPASVGVYLGSLWGGDAIIDGLCIIGAKTGIYVAHGIGNVITNNTIFSGGQAGSVGIEVAPNINRFTITNNVVGNSLVWGANDIGIKVGAGTSDYYTIIGNICKGATVTEISDGGTGTHKTVADNAGDTTINNWYRSGNFMNGGSGVSVQFGSSSYGWVVGGPVAGTAMILHQANGLSGFQTGQIADGTGYLANLDNKGILTRTNSIDRWMFGAAGGFYYSGQTDPGVGIINPSVGYRVAGAAAAGNVLRGDGTNFVSAQLAATDVSGASLIAFKTSVNFNVGNTDTIITLVLPSGYTRYRMNTVFISGASASISIATAGLFTAAAGGGTAIVNAASAISVTSAAEDTNNNMQQMVVNNATSQSHNQLTLFFRVATAQGSPATAFVTVVIQPMS